MRITADDLIGWGSCWGEKKTRSYFAAAGVDSFTPLEILNRSDVSDEDRLWVVLREEIIPERDLRLLACDFADHVMPIWAGAYPDDTRPQDAIAVARRYANGDASAEELTVARDAAGDAAWNAWDAVAAGDAARNAARATAWDAAEAAGAAAAEAAVAARDAAGDAARDAAVAVAAEDAECSWQVSHVRECLELREVASQQDAEVWMTCVDCGTEQPDMGPDICCEVCGGDLAPSPNGEGEGEGDRR